MDDHPISQNLKDLLLGRLPSGEEKAVIAHLITGCQQCLKEIAPFVAAMFRPGRTPSSEGEELYEDAVVSASTAALKRQRSLERERAEADAKIDRLLGGEDPASKSFWTWGLCEKLQERSWTLRQNNPKDMLRLAQFAVETGERLSRRRYGTLNAADLLARAWAGLANAYRISDHLSLAETALEQAFMSFHKGSRSPLLRARLAEISASLLCDQREFPSAFRVLDLAHSLYLRHNAPHDAGRVLIKKGLHTGYTGDPEDGIRLLARGLYLIDRNRDSKLVFQSLHNILLFRVELGHFKSARRQIWEMRPLYGYHEDQIAQVKLRGIEGKVFLGLNEIDRAIRAFEQAKDGFLQKGMNYDAALVSFDLVTIWLQQGKREDARRLLQEMLETFRARYIAREAVATLILLRDAADRNDLTIDVLEKAATLFQTLKEGPASRPEGGDAETPWG
jgi:tetratricopeptide (TPR) repeat protein